MVTVYFTIISTYIEREIDYRTYRTHIITLQIGRTTYVRYVHTIYKEIPYWYSTKRILGRAGGGLITNQEGGRYIRT